MNVPDIKYKKDIFKEAYSLNNFELKLLIFLSSLEKHGKLRTSLPSTVKINILQTLEENDSFFRATFMYEQFPELMNMLWSRMLKDNKKNWRRVYKVWVLVCIYCLTC